MATTIKQYEAEVGSTSGLTPDPWTPWSNTPSRWIVDPLEVNPDLRFPDAARVFTAMHRTDAQVSANLRALMQPTLSAQWDLLGAQTGDDSEGVEGDVRPEVMEFIRSEIGLVEDADPRRRKRREGIVFRDHLREALKCLPIGFSAFEQVYKYSPKDGRLHLRKLAYRPADTIQKINVGADGGLVGIEQARPFTLNPVEGHRNVFIPVNKLVWYVVEKEGADWTGISVLRSAYKDWYIKDKLVRLMGQIVERNGMGVPVAWTSGHLTEAQRAQLDQAMAAFRGGATSGLTLPEGVQFELAGVKGSTVDPLPAINYHDQQISKSMLAMFLDLGHDAGARSLGDTFRAIYLDACQSIADSIADTFTEHVIRDLVELNYGPDEPYPVLTAGDLQANAGASVDELKALADAGLITPDDTLEETLRARKGLPEIDKASRPAPPVPAATGAPGAGGVDTSTATPPGDDGTEGTDRFSDPGHLDRVDALLSRVEHLNRTRTTTPDTEESGH